MVNAVNGQGQGNYVDAFSRPNQPTVTEESSDPVLQNIHRGKGRDGAPGQLAKQMLSGTPPAGFSLGNLVSLIAQGDMDGAQNLVNSAIPPTTEEPITETDTIVVTLDPETPEVITALPESNPDTGDANEVPYEQPSIVLTPDANTDPSILDLFEPFQGVDETV